MSRFALAVLCLCLQSACASQVMPLQVAAPILPPAGFQTAQPTLLAPGFQTTMGLQGEEIELNGIYSLERGHAELLLRNGESVSLLNHQSQALRSLHGIEARSALRVRGLLRTRAAAHPAERLGLMVGQVFRA